MKRCPTCGRSYIVETLNYCLDDGASLIYGPASNEPETAILRSTEDRPGESPTAIIPLSIAAEAGIGLTQGGQIPGITNPASSQADDKGNAVTTNFRPKSWLSWALIPLVFVTIAAGGYLAFRYFTPHKQIESIAVLPFTNEAGNPEIEYLSDGITESLINSLSKLPQLAVKARSSVFTYKGKDVSPQQVARDLSVQAILNGRVIQRGDQIMLSLELMDATTGNQIWGEQYNRKLTDLTALQSEIARDVSNKLQSKLSGADEQKVTKNYTQNTEAYQLYLKGKYHWNKRTRADITKSIDYFQQAAEKDPTYALAYSGLAEAFILMPAYANESPQVAYPRARAAAVKALEIDKSLAEAHAALAAVTYEYEWNFAAAEPEFLRAIELNPNYATAHHWYSEYLLSQGRNKEALNEMKRAQELDPLSLIINGLLGVIYRVNGQFDEALVQLNRTVELDPKFPRTHIFLAEVYQDKGMFNEAADEFGKLALLAGSSPGEASKGVAALKEAYKSRGARGYYAVLAANLQARRNDKNVDSPPPATIVAGYWAQAGETEKAIALLDDSYNRHDPEMTRIRGAIFDPIKSDARYQEILRRMELGN